jgi:hypothetical protein
MAAANLLLMPIFTSIRPEIILSWLPLISIFNAVQGLLSVFGGFIFYEAVMLRLPSLKAK